MDFNSYAISLEPAADHCDEDAKELHRTMIVHSIADAKNRVVFADNEKDFSGFRSINSLGGAV